MIAYHVTTRESAASLPAVGADRSRVGRNGGIQGGVGFYCAPTREDAEYWRNRIGRPDDAILVVRLPESARIAPPELCQLDDDAIAWAVEHGYVADRELTGRAWQLIAGPVGDREDWGLLDEEAVTWTLLGLYLADRGYDGYRSQDDSIVLTNWGLLGPEAFGREEDR